MKTEGEVLKRAGETVQPAAAALMRKPVKNAMRCPNKACGHWRVKVLDTWSIKNGKTVVRRRKCEACGIEWSTQEGQIEEVSQ